MKERNRFLHFFLCPILLAFWGFAAASLVVAQNQFDYPDFSSDAGINLVGDAQIVSDVLRLTEAVSDQKGAAWFDRKVSVAEGFQTQFRFQITDGSADGFAFVIQNTSADAISTVPDCGSCLGYSGIPNSLAVEFDTYEDYGISVHSRGTLPNDYDEQFSLGSTDAILEFLNGDVHEALIDYVPGTMSIFIDDFDTPILTVDVTLDTLLNLDNGRAFAGFTAATGGLSENHDILSWSFSASGGNQAVAVDPLGRFVLYTSTSMCADSALMHQRITETGLPSGSPKMLVGCGADVQDVDLLYEPATDNYWVSFGTSEGKLLMKITPFGGISISPVNVLETADIGSLGPAAIGGKSTIYVWVGHNDVIFRASIRKDTLTRIRFTQTSLPASGSALQASQNVSNRLLALDVLGTLTGSKLTKGGLPTGTPAGLLPHTGGNHLTGGISSDGRISYSINGDDELFVQRVDTTGLPLGSEVRTTFGSGLVAADVSNVVGNYRFVVYKNDNGVYLQRITGTGQNFGSERFLGY